MRLPANGILMGLLPMNLTAKAAVQCSSPLQIYDFTYEIKDNQLYIDFVNESAHDATYEFSVKGDTLILIGGEGTIGGTYELTKVHDKKADK